MVNVTNAPSASGASTVPATSTLPDTLAGFQQSTTQYAYASPSGTLNDVNGGFPRFIGNVRLAVTLAAGNATWTGLGGGSDGQRVILWNADASSTLTLAIANAGSQVNNRFNGTSGTYSLAPGNAYELIYYAGTINAWVINGAAAFSGGTGTVTSVNITPPASGISASGGPITTSGAITLALTDDLAALEALSTTGLAARTGTSTWVPRTITGTANRLGVTNGDGVAGAPTLDISATYAGQSSITTLGTIATGVWQGTAIDLTAYVSGALPAANFPAMTGDVTNTAGTLVTAIGANKVTTSTINANAVTLAKLATQADQTILGNNTGGAAVPLALTAAQTRTVLGLATVATSGSAADLTGTLGAAQLPALSGDISSSAGSATTAIGANKVTTTTINANAVTLAKLATQADQTILGNNTGGTAVPLALTAAQTKTVLSLNNVENTALSTWAGSANITTLGTVAALKMGAGSASALSWPTMASGTVLTSPVAGTWEWDGTNLFFTPAASQRTIVPLQIFIRQHSDRGAFSNNTNQQAIFDSVTNGTITLETGAYTFEALIQGKGMSGTSGNFKWSLIGAGGATLTNIMQFFVGYDNAPDTQITATGVALIAATSTGTNIVGPATATVCTILVRGSFECTGAGTVIPSVAQTTATTTAVITAGSYMSFTRLGASSAVSIGNWS